MHSTFAFLAHNDPQVSLERACKERIEFGEERIYDSVDLSEMCEESTYTSMPLFP